MLIPSCSVLYPKNSSWLYANAVLTGFATRLLRVRVYNTSFMCSRCSLNDPEAISRSSIYVQRKQKRSLSPKTFPIMSEMLRGDYVIPQVVLCAYRPLPSSAMWNLGYALFSLHFTWKYTLYRSQLVRNNGFIMAIISLRMPYIRTYIHKSLQNVRLGQHSYYCRRSRYFVNVSKLTLFGLPVKLLFSH